MRMKQIALIAGFLLSSGWAAAFNEPDGLQMLKFGQDVRNILPKCDTLPPAQPAACWPNWN
jgi:hypothetical protein